MARADQKATLDTVVATATRTEEKRKDFSNSMAIKDSGDIQETPAGNLAERVAGGPMGAYDKLILPSNLPPMLHITQNAPANGSRRKGCGGRPIANSTAGSGN